VQWRSVIGSALTDGRIAAMPLVHRFTGPSFAPSRAPAPRIAPVGIAVAPSQQPDPQAAPSASEASICRLCRTRVPMFDLSLRCCVDRYEAQFGSADQHRSLIANARQAAISGDLGPAWRLVESYRRVFGPMPALELRRVLWRSIDDARLKTPALPSALAAFPAPELSER
jgi:hypothetical protein